MEKYNEFIWDEQAVINLQYIMFANPIADPTLQDYDNLRQLAKEFTTYERNNNIKYNEDGNTDWESTIEAFLQKKAEENGRA